MKITKRQLRRIIKEEYRRAINEADIRITAGSSDYYETDGMTEYNFDVELNGAQQSVSFEMGGFPADAEDVASTLAPSNWMMRTRYW